jgi:hypothetical protein
MGGPGSDARMAHALWLLTTIACILLGIPKEGRPDISPVDLVPEWGPENAADEDVEDSVVQAVMHFAEFSDAQQRTATKYPIQS